MENLIERRSNLVMPQNCIELDREEMSYVSGGDYYIDNSTCITVIGAIFGGLYFGGMGMATAIMCGIVSKTTISAMVYSLIGSISAVNIFLGGLLAVVGKLAVEIIVNMAVASFNGKGVMINTLKIWGWDTGIPTGACTR